MNYVIEPEKKTKIYDEVDVVVCGGGPAGIGAAISSARSGMKTLLVEQMGCLGGIGTAGLHPQMQVILDPDNDHRVCSIPMEIGALAEKRNCGMRGYRYGKGCLQYEIEGMKRLYDDMVLESGCKILYLTFVVDTIMENNEVKGVIIENKSGRSAILAKRVIDCTADADIAYHAGAEFEYGRDFDKQVQPCTLMFRVDGADVAKVEANHDDNADNVWLRAIEAGDMPPFQTHLMGFWVTHTRPNQIAVNFTNFTNVDPTNADDLTKILIEGRKQAEIVVKVMKKYIPGCENIYMIDSALLPGTRESRRIIGEYMMTVEDVLSARKFDDGIACGNYYVDIHNPVGTGMYNHDPSKEYRQRRLPPNEFYSIPYRCMIPKKVQNLLVAGRCISVTHEALGSVRVMMQCMELGEAAGSAAAWSIRNNCGVRDVDVSALKKEMTQSIAKQSK